MVAADKPTSLPTKASVRRSGPTLPMTVTVASSTSSSSTSFGRGMPSGLEHVRLEVRSPVGRPAVDIGEPVLLGQLPAGDGVAVVLCPVGIGRERGDGTRQE